MAAKLFSTSLDYLAVSVRNLRNRCHCEAYFTIEIGRGNLNLLIKSTFVRSIQIASSSPIRSGPPRNDIIGVGARIAVSGLFNY
jgi:hypothetical protein